MNRRYDTSAPEDGRPVPAEPAGVPAERCELCGRDLAPVDRHAVTIPDSAFVHADDDSEDGRRPAVACSREHAVELVARGTRTWVNEELWLGKVLRVSSRWRRRETTLDQFAALAGLTPYQLRRALRWRMAQVPSQATREQAPTERRDREQ